MSWSDAGRRPPFSRGRAALAALVLAVTPLALGGCGFTPMYGAAANRSAAAAELAQVQIDPIPERNGQVLRNHLIDRFYTGGRPANPTYRLAINLVSTEEELGIRQDATATRARLRLVANYELIDTRTGQVVYRTFSRSIVAYNLLEAQYATLVSQQDAYERGLTELAEDIRTRLALYFKRDPQAAQNPAPDTAGNAAKP